MIGSTVDKYEVLQKVGEGGMATVYRGRHTTLDRDVAIKVLHPHLSSSTRNRKRFAREARAIEHLRHHNILEIFDYSGIDSGDCYIITEFVEGQTLTSLLEQRGRLPSEIVARIGTELCGALGYAHSSGILHRDLKPDNVMIRTDGTVKLMDFGIARFLDESQVTLTGALVGSPAFMSPEQAIEAELDARSDLFSLGTVLFQLVSGHLPFTGSNPSLILKNVIEGNRPHVTELVPSIAPGLADVIERLLSTDPAGRFTTAEDVGEALKASLAESGLGDPTDARFSLPTWLADPDATERQLGEHVQQALLATGKARLAGGDALGALRVFNRLLALDEGHQEVLELIQALHAEPTSPPSRPVPLVALVVAASVTAALILVLLVLPWLDPGPPPPVQPTATVPPAPVPPAPAPPPTPVPEPAPTVEPTPTAPASPQPLPDRVVPAPERPSPLPDRARPTPRPTPDSVVRRTVPANSVVPRAVPRNSDVPRAVPQNPAPDPAALEVPTPTGPGRLRIVSNLAADVYHQGRKLGSTRSPIPLDPGSYILEIRSDVVLPTRVRVDIGPDEDVERSVTVQARPATIRLADFDAGCAVVLDGAAMGTVGALQHVLQVPRPDQPGHELQVACPGRDLFVHRWPDVVLPGEVVAP